MDKYEYKVRLDEIFSLIDEQEFARAVEIADTIDWRRVKSIKTLCTISDLYKINRRYQESKEILLMAYERYPGGRLIVYSLCELSIKLEEYVQAIEYYKEYVQIAPKDTSRYILQYRLYEAQDVGLEERVEVLEEFKHKDYREKWAYELAYLYHRMGLASKCVDECDELIVTFGEGRFVIKAMELKMLHEPLSAFEQAKYDAWMKDRDDQILREKQELYSESPDAEVSASMDTADLKGAPTTELPTEVDIQVKTVDVGQYNTVNLQEALAESMKDIWNEEVGSTQEIVPSTPEDAEDSTFFGTSPMAGYAFAADEVADNSVAENPDAQEIITESETLIDEEPEAVEPVEPATMVAMPTEAVNQVLAAEPAPEPVFERSEPLVIKTVPEDTVLTEETKRIPTEAVVDYLDAQRLVEQMQMDSASLAASEEQADKIPGAITGSIRINVSSNSDFDQMLDQESDGQIRLALPDSEQLEKQITGQLSIEDILTEWENTKKINEEKRRQEVKQRILQHTGSIFDEFDEDTRAGLLEQLEKAFRDAIVREAQNGKKGSEELNERINAEARKAAEHLNRDAVTEEEPDEDIDEGAAVEPDTDVEEIPEEEIPEEVLSEEDEEVSGEDSTQEPVDEDDFPEVEVDEEEAAAEVKAVMKALAEDEEESSSEDSDAADDSDSEGERELSEEEESFFAQYITRKSTKRQIIAALDNMSLASYTGNVIITGEEGVGTIDLAKRLVKHLQAADSNLVGQVGKVSGKSLNSKDIDEALNQLKNGALIIETARGMKRSTVEKIIKALEVEDLGLLVILEDTAEGMNRITTAIPEITRLFNVRIDLKALDDKALVSYAKEYALSQEYSIDEFGILALHTRIEEMQTSDHQVTIAEVRDLVDDAIYFAEKKTPAHFFDVVFHKRYDKEDMVVLREKDFMHY